MGSWICLPLSFLSPFHPFLFPQLSLYSLETRPTSKKKKRKRKERGWCSLPLSSLWRCCCCSLSLAFCFVFRFSFLVAEEWTIGPSDEDFCRNCCCCFCFLQDLIYFLALWMSSVNFWNQRTCSRVRRRKHGGALLFYYACCCFHDSDNLGYYPRCAPMAHSSSSQASVSRSSSCYKPFSFFLCLLHYVSMCVSVCLSVFPGCKTALFVNCMIVIPFLSPLLLSL